MYMSPVNCLLISRCPTVIDQVKGAAMNVARLQVEVCSAQRAPGRLHRDDVGQDEAVDVVLGLVADGVEQGGPFVGWQGRAG